MRKKWKNEKMEKMKKNKKNEKMKKGAPHSYPQLRGLRLIPFTIITQEQVSSPDKDWIMMSIP